MVGHYEQSLILMVLVSSALKFSDTAPTFAETTCKSGVANSADVQSARGESKTPVTIYFGCNKLPSSKPTNDGKKVEPDTISYAFTECCTKATGKNCVATGKALKFSKSSLKVEEKNVLLSNTLVYPSLTTKTKTFCISCYPTSKPKLVQISPDLETCYFEPEEKDRYEMEFVREDGEQPLLTNT